MSFFEEQIVTLLTTSWNPNNTNSRTPKIQVIYDTGRANLWDGDYILLYNINEVDEPNGFGNTSKKQTRRVRVDIRSNYSLSHLEKLVNETRRVLDGKRRQPVTGYDVLLPTGEARNLSDRSKRIYRYVMDWWGTNYNEVVTPI